VAKAVRYALVAVGTYAAICLLLWLFRERMVFPVRGGEAVQAQRVDTAGVLGWYWPGRDVAMLWFHGNGETVAGLAGVMREFRPDGVALLALDYRGTIAEAERDAAAALAWLRGRGFGRVVVYGRSVGTGPAVYVAATQRVEGLVLESAFTSVRALARLHYPFFPTFLAPGGFKNEDRMGDVSCPVLFVHGDADRLIPIEMGRTLEARTQNRAGFVVIPGADHNDTYAMGGASYAAAVKEFVLAGSAP
jgi:pimeloyl-ACP methyl ester carboxylesterase